MVGFPTKLSRTPGTLRLPPPLLGQHTEEVLQNIGFSDEDITVMRKDGTI
jgi:formyl-CoA transferase/CoA:oxalate CoA-transferase